MALEDNTYVLIRGFYADCPTCDPVIDDPEFIKTDVVSGEELIEEVCTNLNKYSDVTYLKAYKILDGGRLHFVCDFEPINGFHCLVGLKFKMHGKEYKIIKFQGKFQLETPQIKVLYGKTKV